MTKPKNENEKNAENKDVAAENKEGEGENKDE